VAGRLLSAVRGRRLRAASFRWGEIRSLFVSPDAAKRSFFYGINFELGYEMPQFSSTMGLEIRPILGVRNKEWEFIVKPIVDVSFGSNGEADFAPALRLARNLGNDRFLALEYYADFGQDRRFLPFRNQSQQLFAVTDSSSGFLMSSWVPDRSHSRIRSLCYKDDLRLRLPRSGK